MPRDADRPLAHRLGAAAFALAVGGGLAWLAYQWATDPLPREQRRVEEAVVLEARRELVAALGDAAELEIVDPLQPNRVAGKTFIYPVREGWQVSGFYRRGDAGPWRPWLMTLDEGGELLSMAVDGVPDAP